jgi:hypothetical protein
MQSAIRVIGPALLLVSVSMAKASIMFEYGVSHEYKGGAPNEPSADYLQATIQDHSDLAGLATNEVQLTITANGITSSEAVGLAAFNIIPSVLAAGGGLSSLTASNDGSSTGPAPTFTKTSGGVGVDQGGAYTFKLGYNAPGGGTLFLGGGTETSIIDVFLGPASFHLHATDFLSYSTLVPSQGSNATTGLSEVSFFESATDSSSSLYVLGVVPEPGSIIAWSLLCGGAAGILPFRKRRKGGCE